MEVFSRMRKGCSINNERSPQKKIKLESDDRMKEEEDEHGTPEEFSNPVPWQKIEAEGLDCDYAQLFSKGEADDLFQKLEDELVYSTGTKSLFIFTGGECYWIIEPVSVPGEEATVQVFGKVYNIPRKQATYGDAGLTYTYSGITRVACPWTPALEYIRDAVTRTTGQMFNFVVVNRWEANSQILESLGIVSLLKVWSIFLLYQVQRRAGSHGGASRRWKGAGPPLSHRFRLLRGSAWFHLQTQRCSGENDPATDGACEAGAGSWKPPPHEPPHQHILVPQPPCSQEDLTGPHKPHI